MTKIIPTNVFYLDLSSLLHTRLLHCHADAMSQTWPGAHALSLRSSESLKRIDDGKSFERPHVYIFQQSGMDTGRFARRCDKIRKSETPQPFTFSLSVYKINAGGRRSRQGDEGVFFLTSSLPRLVMQFIPRLQNENLYPFQPFTHKIARLILTSQLCAIFKLFFCSGTGTRQVLE